MRVLVCTEMSDRPESAIISGIAQRGIPVHVVCHPNSPFLPLFQQHCEVVTPLSVRGRFDITAVCALRNQLTKQRFDILHAFTGRTLAAAVLASYGLATRIVSYRGTVGHLSRLDPTSWVSFLSPRVSATMCVSNAVREYMLSLGIPSTRLFTIHKGHSPDWYRAAPRAALEEFGLSPNDIVVACTANARPVKGVDVLLNAVSDLPPSSKVKVLLIGELRDPRLRSLLESPNLRSRVIALGHRSDAAALAGACDIVVVPSREREGFPKAVLEAMAQKRPVIASAVGGIPEILTDSMDGILVPPADPARLRTALQNLVGNAERRACLGASAFETLLQRFTPEMSIEKVLHMYREVLSR